ncbi:hypothetical protein B0A49_01524 [Cryomyces minteri]|uniref:Uncharacterized protein n=1 Tax=Cryomyces minteri TaxID=331657 RepID=A0A4U0WYZ9_9PEZI|nr:hypothetical protein B0A49_09279 [Cryomyces minteri]TKA81013.1 hypothetical protein B0A49_01524 [Cryomyces minteri]
MDPVGVAHLAEIYYPVNDAVVSARQTLLKSWLLYAVLVVQPVLSIAMLVLCTFFYATPIDDGFDLVAIPAGVEKGSVDLLKGAALSGESYKLAVAKMSSPGPIAEAMGKLAYTFSEVQPYLPMYLHLVVSALFPIYTAAHASLSRPSSAAKPAKRVKSKHGDASDEEDEEEPTQKMEGLSPRDAIVFPVIAGTTLAGLYFLIKWLDDPTLLNKILNWYFSSFGVLSVSKMVADRMGVVHSIAFPSRYVDKGVVWKVDGRERSAVPQSSSEKKRDSPLPVSYSRIPLPKKTIRSLWRMQALAKKQYIVKIYIHRVAALKFTIGVFGVLSALVGLSTVVYFNFFDKPWYLTNLMGFAFAYGALQIMSPTTFATGSLILGALFFYDVYFVFYTPMMVTVAKSLDIPIKLLFPRPAPAGAGPDVKQSLAMLGLGDIVLPRLMIGLALRFDLYMHYLKKQTKASAPSTAKADATAADPAANDSTPPTKSSTFAPEAQHITKAPYVSPSGQWGTWFWLPWRDSTVSTLQQLEVTSLPKPYFHASIAGYILGLCTTLGVMHVFAHAQPALLYLVPGVVGSVWLTALVRREIKAMWNFSEASEEDDDGKEVKKNEKSADAAAKPSSGGSIFGPEKQKRIAERLEKSMGSYVDVGGAESEHESESESEAKVNTPISSTDETQGRRSPEKTVSSEESPTPSSPKNKPNDTKEKKETKEKKRKAKTTKMDLFTRDHTNELVFFSITRRPAPSPSSSSASHNAKHAKPAPRNGNDADVQKEAKARRATSGTRHPHAESGDDGEPAGKRQRRE